MERKKKICKGCGKLQFIFSHGLCSFCYKNNDKRKLVGLKPIKSIKPKSGYAIPKRGKKSLKSPYFAFKSQLELFVHLWLACPKDKNGRMYCEFTGERIDYFWDSDRWLNCFSHILPKGRFPHFKLNKENVRVVHPDFHYSTENFTEDMRDKYPDWDFDKWFKLEEEMKIKYKKFVKDNLISFFCKT